MDGNDSFNEQTQRAKVKAGFKGGPFFKNPALAAIKTFADGVPSEVKAKEMRGNIPSANMTDPWYGRR